MPGIFNSIIDKNGSFPPFPDDSGKPPIDIPNCKPIWASKNKWIFLFLIVIPLLLIQWSHNSTKVSNFPRMHADFIGRVKELHFLESQLLKKPSSNEINLIAICGEGGIGKTELSIAFASKHLKDFSLIGWIDGSDEETLLHSYAKLGDLLGVKEENLIRLQEKVHSHLSTFKGKPWLLIFDDMRSIPSQPPRSGGAVIITCRDKSICPPESVLELTKNSEDALLLLSKITQQKRSEAMEKLAQQLDYLPLMINIAGHYIYETPTITLSNYSAILSSIIETDRSPLNAIEFRKRYPRSLAATYLITLKLLGEKHPLSLEFFKTAVFLHPKNIPSEFLTHWLEKKGKYDTAQIVLLKGDILRELQNHSLIRYDSKRGNFTIHQLLHQALKLEFKDIDKAAERLKIISELGAVLRYNPTQKDTIRPFQKILPQCTTLLDQIDTPNHQAVKLALTVIRYFFDTEHNLKKGGKYLMQAHAWAENWDHPVKGRILFLQGVQTFRETYQLKDTTQRKDHYLHALALFKRAQEVFERHSQDNLYEGIEQNTDKCTQEYQRAICLQYQAQMLRHLGKIEEAQQGFQQALEAFEKIAQGKDHFDIARILREQALILWDQGHQEKAIINMQNVIAMQERTYGPTYHFQPTAAATFRMLGDFYLERKEFLKSDQAYEKAIKISQAAYQTHIHPYLAELYHQRSLALEALGESSRAQKMEKKAQKARLILQQSGSQ